MSDSNEPTEAVFATWVKLDGDGYAEVRVGGKRLTTVPSYSAAEEMAERINTALAARRVSSVPSFADGIEAAVTVVCDPTTDPEDQADLERQIAELLETRALLALIAEEAGKDNAPFGRSDSFALARIREALGLSRPTKEPAP